MKYSKVIALSLLLAAGIIRGLPVAYADQITVKSKITDVNASSEYLKVNYFDPQTEKTEEIKLDVEPGAHFEGFESLKDLKVDDEVTIEANYNAFTHEWKALSIGPYHQE